MTVSPTRLFKLLGFSTFSLFSFFRDTQKSSSSGKRLENNLKHKSHHQSTQRYIYSTLYKPNKIHGDLTTSLIALPMTHKKDCRLRPTLFMIYSVQHKLANHLSRLLQHFTDIHSTFCVNDSFTYNKFGERESFKP